MKKLLLTTIMISTLAACSSQPSKTLDEKLSEAQTLVHRKEILRLACLNEAEWPIYSSYAYKRGSVRIRQSIRNRYNPEVSQMKSLCRQMDNFTTADAEEKLPPKELATACAAKVTAKKQKDRKGWVEHADRIAHICQEMTGQKL